MLDGSIAKKIVWPFNYIARSFNIIFSCGIISESCNDIASSLIRLHTYKVTILNKHLLWHSETIKSLYFGETGQILNFFFLIY